MIDALNAEPGTLTGFDCPECLNRGYVWCRRESGERYQQECACMVKRRNARYLRESGLQDMLQRCTFERWQAREPWQRALLELAKRYAEHPNGWLYLAGQPGTGKTHLCTAVCGALMERGMPCRYLLWRDFAAQAKACVNDAEAYGALMRPLKAVRVLYVDDLLKTGRGAEPTAADLNLAFELLNARYNDARKLTILSSELTINRVLDLDEGVGSRIFQRSKGNYADLTGKRNYRLS